MKPSNQFTLGGSVFVGMGWAFKFSNDVDVALFCFAVALPLFFYAIYLQWLEKEESNG